VLQKLKRRKNDDDIHLYNRCQTGLKQSLNLYRKLRPINHPKPAAIHLRSCFIWIDDYDLMKTLDTSAETIKKYILDEVGKY